MQVNHTAYPPVVYKLYDNVGKLLADVAGLGNDMPATVRDVEIASQLKVVLSKIDGDGNVWVAPYRLAWYVAGDATR